VIAHFVYIGRIVDHHCLNFLFIILSFCVFFVVVNIMLFSYFKVLWFLYVANSSDSAGHRSQDTCPPISQIVLKNFLKISLIIKECLEEILLKLAIDMNISKSS